MKRPLAALTALAIAGCGGASTPRGSGPPLILTLPADVEGKTVALSAYEGRFLVVHVFTTWAMPSTDDALRLVEAFGDDTEVAIVGVALDPRGAAVVAPWRRGVGVDYPIALASDRVRGGASQLGSTRAVPFTLLFDREGRRMARWDRPLGATGIAEIKKRIGR